jgi:hypothetical protein
VFPWEFHFDVDGSSITNAVAPNIGLAMLTDTNNTAIFRVELTDRMIDCVAAILTQSSDNLVL